MRYVSTRGQAPEMDFAGVLLAGLASDGGLYMPSSWPRFSAEELKSLRGLPYPELAAKVIAPFAAGSVSEAELLAMCKLAYAEFANPAIVPLVQLETNLYALELFHGPTLAFKDYALQLLGRLFDHVLTRKGQRVTIVGATSGDTGSAAIEACRDREAVDIIILHPHGRVSEVQRRQMTTVASANVHNIALDGTFDDCQDMVKAMFNDQAFRDALRLSAVNSINWARIMAQIVYYFAAGTALGAPQRPLSFAVPTGNFGNVYAAFAARRMGLPIAQLVVGSNANDILTRFFESGTMRMDGVRPTLSPSMDIQVSSNFERYLFDMLNEDGARVRAVMEAFRAQGRYEVEPAVMQDIATLFSGHRLDDEATRLTIRRLHQETGELLDPHSAIGVAAGRACRRDAAIPMVALATAHPAKFPAAVEAATGVRPALPPRLADLFERPERYDVLPNDLEAVKAYVRRAARVTA